MKDTWDAIKQGVRSHLPKRGFSLWIDPISFLGAKGDSVVLGCPNRFSRDWVTENYLGLIKEKFLDAGLGHLDLVFKVQPARQKDSPPCPGPEQLALPNIRRKGPRALWLNSQFTFDRFIVGQSNEFAFSASKNIALGDPCNYHSLLMLSNTGLGKTHLSQAIGHTVLKKNPDSRVFYISAEDFTNEMISSLKANRIEEFKNRYRRSCDVLLLEEVHFLGGKEKIQAELGYTLDALADDNKKIIFTSSLPPKDIPRMSKDLASRLTSGLVTTIAGPDYETRLRILTRKALEYKVPLSKDILRFLAERLKRDVRHMESALKSLKACSELVGAKIDIQLAKEVVSSLTSGENSVTTKDIKELVANYYKVDPEMLGSRSRKRIYTYPRNIYAYLCRRHSDETLAGIAQTINRSHSTVLYAAELVASKIKTDRNMKNQVDFLSKRVEEMKR